MSRKGRTTTVGYRRPESASEGSGLNAIVAALASDAPHIIAHLSARGLLFGDKTTRRPTKHRPLDLPYADQTHEHIEIACVLRGRCLVQINDRYLEARQGDIAVFPPGVAHADTFVQRDVSYSLLWFSIENRRVGTHLTRYSRSAGFHILFGVSCDTIVSAPRLTKSILVAAEEDRIGPTSLIHVRAVLLELCSLMLNYILQMDASARHDWHAALIESVVDYLRNHYLENPSLTEISRHVRLSPNYVCALFRKHTGRTIFSHINALRMKKAEELLLNSALSVKEIAREAGFASAHYFSRTFRRIHGASPVSFRAARS